MNRIILQMITDVMAKNDMIDRCLEDDYYCSVKGVDEDYYLAK